MDEYPIPDGETFTNTVLQFSRWQKGSRGKSGGCHLSQPNVEVTWIVCLHRASRVRLKKSRMDGNPKMGSFSAKTTGKGKGP